MLSPQTRYITNITRLSLIQHLRRLQDWFPPATYSGRLGFVRWVLLEGNRLVVTGIILMLVYVTLLATGLVWTSDIQAILTETSTIKNILDTFMSGIILLVSIVVSINAIVLSQDIASVQNEADQTRGTREFRGNIGNMTESGESPSDPRAFLQLMATVITDRAQTLADEASGTEQEFADEMEAYTASILSSIDHLETVDNEKHGDFDALWTALEVNYGAFLERSRTLRNDHRGEITESCGEQWDELVESIQLFAIGRENFKTLYYYKEVSVLSRTLLVVSLPTILVIAMAVFAFSASRFPEFYALGIPPLQIFAATVFTVALLPYVVLTSYMLRLSTVGIRTASAGPFSLND